MPLVGVSGTKLPGKDFCTQCARCTCTCKDADLHIRVLECHNSKTHTPPNTQTDPKPDTLSPRPPNPQTYPKPDTLNSISLKPPNPQTYPKPSEGPSLPAAFLSPVRCQQPKCGRLPRDRPRCMQDGQKSLKHQRLVM